MIIFIIVILILIRRIKKASRANRFTFIRVFNNEVNENVINDNKKKIEIY